MKKMKSLKVLYSSYFGDFTRGGQKSLFGLINQLDRTHVSPMVLLPEEGELADLLRDIECPVYISPLVNFRKQFFWNIFKPSARNWYKSVKLIRDLIFQLEPDIIHCDDPNDTVTCGFAIRAAFRSTMRLVWHIRLTGSSSIDQIAARMADGLIGVSEGTIQRLGDRKRLLQKFTRIYNGVDLERFHPADNKNQLRQAMSLPKHRFILLFAGELKKEKGVFEIIKAMNIVKNDMGTTRSPLLLMAGTFINNELKRNLEKYIHLYHLQEQVKLLPYQTNIHEWMQASDALIMASHEGAEGFGRVIAEAMACGIVPLVANISGCRETIAPDTGLIFEPRSSESLAETIIGFMTNKDCQNVSRVKGPEHARALFDIRNHARLVETFYERLLRLE